MDRNEKLKALALRHLGTKDFNGLKKWYDQCVSSDAEYVVFVVRRSYILALILEALTEQRMEDNGGKRFVTDSAFLLCCEELASYYQDNLSFPKIILCDDMLIHGRNLNRVIGNVEECLYDLLPQEDREKIHDALSVAIHIRVYCYAQNDHLWLNSAYGQDATCIERYKPEKWHELSSRISSLIVDSGYANATYIYSEIISKEECECIINSNSGYRKQNFQNITAYTKISFLQNGSGDVYAIYTIRILKNRVDENFRVIPFVFMPNLDASETRLLLNGIRASGQKKGIPDSFFKMIKRLSDIKGKRAFNEWISLIISQTLLQEFNEKYSIKRDLFREEDYEREIVKLARNYRFDQSADHVNYLKLCIKETPFFSSIKELSDILLLCNCNRPVFTFGDQSVDNWKIQRTVEDYFYEKGYEEELDAIHYDGYPDLRSDVSRRTVRGCCFVYRGLLDRRTLNSSEYGVSSFLLMMDAGVLALSSHPPKDVNVVGYAQFAKAGEQSLLLKPLRYMKYIPFLSVAYNWCRQFNKDFIEHLEQFKGTGACEIDGIKIDELIVFIKEIAGIEQTVLDWYGDYYEKVDFGLSPDEDKQKALISAQYAFENAKNKYVEDYKQYMLELTENF